jgi:hypothetical protein
MLSALKEMDYQQFGEDALIVEAFVSSWGGLDHSNLVRAIREGTGEEDMVLAILAIGFLDMPENREILVSLLESPYPKARWVSAYCLGTMRDICALPVLRNAVTEFLPPNIPYMEDMDGQLHEDWFYDTWREKVMALLYDLERS